MDWIDHPGFKRVRDEVVDRLKRDSYRFRRLRPVVFLCGARNSLPRDRLAAYLRQHLPVLVFYAEGVWEAIAQYRPEANALEMEGELASLADAVIVIVESPGTFAELGAFALTDSLRVKLLPILEISFRGQKSFLESGPVRWIDRSSHFRPSIWTCLESILEAAGEIEERLARIAKPRPAEITDLSASPQHLVFFLADLVSVFGPCPKSQIDRLAEAILGRSLVPDSALLLALAAGMEVLKTFQMGGQEFYYRPLDDGTLSSFHRTRKFADVGSLRAEVVGTMLALPETRALLKELEMVTSAT
ncbi:hypothetical protein BH24GEM1_BH24GEM1_01900 [soil metagenome]